MARIAGAGRVAIRIDLPLANAHNPGIPFCIGHAFICSVYLHEVADRKRTRLRLPTGNVAQIARHPALMATPNHPSPVQLQQQIAGYRKELPHYQAYAGALKGVLEAACKTQLREAIVQARPKDVSSFAEKYVRKFDRYPNAVAQMTDLCGARVIVQTQSQVESVRRFVEQNFIVVETEDIGLRLGEKEFGYRDRHYIVQLNPERALAIGFTPQTVKTIGTRKAELQIRTWAQHTWADTLHDRTYKSPLKLTAEVSRTAALLAALMEDGDRNFDRLANELDGMVANYAAYAGKAKVQEEVQLQEFLLTHEPDPKHKPRLALQLARLHTALGNHHVAVKLLEPLSGNPLALRNPIDLELGTALCHAFRTTPRSAEYVRGRTLLETVVDRLAKPDFSAVPNLRKSKSLRARALSRLGWAWEAEENREKDARLCYRQALESEPGNPYYLADMLGFELDCAPRSEITASMSTNIKSAISVCAGHAADGIELPFAYFTAGRLRLLLGEKEAALHDYLRGARYCLDGEGCFGCEVVDQEISWLHRVNRAADLPQAYRWAKELLLLAKVAKSCCECGGATTEPLPPAHANIAAKVLIVAGGASSIAQQTIGFVREPLTQALRTFHGTVVSGGTKVGIPGLVGEIGAKLTRTGSKCFQLIGYHPPTLPADAPPDRRYDQLVQCGEGGFSPDQILANWTDILRAGIKPRDVTLLGVGGGPVSSVEYRVALALGATVALVSNSRGAADALLADPLWKGFPNLLPLPFDTAALRAVLENADSDLPPQIVVNMARAFHADYVAHNQHKVPENLRTWDNLPGTFVKANLEQARYVAKILESAGFVVRPAKQKSQAPVRKFTPKEIEHMAALEHGRWTVERLRDGWRPGPRDNAKKTHDCLVPWRDLSDGHQGVRRHDRNSVIAYPTILAQAGLAIYRRP
jgi:ppGpp synthetase/RelA/SpoT-type nucleotidyltranferase